MFGLRVISARAVWRGLKWLWEGFKKNLRIRTYTLFLFFLFVITSNFGAEAERSSFFFCDLSLKPNVLNLSLKLWGIVFQYINSDVIRLQTELFFNVSCSRKTALLILKKSLLVFCPVRSQFYISFTFI